MQNLMKQQICDHFTQIIIANNHSEMNQAREEIWSKDKIGDSLHLSVLMKYLNFPTRDTSRGKGLGA